MGWLSLATVHQSLVKPDERGAVFQRYMRRWAGSLVRSSGGAVELTPESRLPSGPGPRLIVANHRSPFDIGILLSIFGGHAVSRADLASWPILGLAARRAGTIFVDRQDPGSGASAIRAIRRRLREGASVLIFPEGSTFEGDEVRPFKAGVFAALPRQGVEIVPVGLAYDPGVEWIDETFVNHVLRVANRPRTRCLVSVGTPRPVGARAPELAQLLRDDVQQLVQHARASFQP